MRVAEADDAQLDEITAALFEYGVVVLPEQHLTPQENLYLAEHIGPIDIN